MLLILQGKMARKLLVQYSTTFQDPMYQVIGIFSDMICKETLFHYLINRDFSVKTG